MEGMKDWNKMKLEEHIDHLENKFLVDSSGTAKSVFELIAAYRALIISSVLKPLPNKEEQEFEDYLKKLSVKKVTKIYYQLGEYKFSEEYTLEKYEEYKSNK